MIIANEGHDRLDAPEEKELLEDARLQKKMIKEVEAYETAFRNVCKDMIEMMYSKEKLQQIIDDEWEHFPGAKYHEL